MAALNDDQEAALAAARARKRQDKKVPFLIHIEDARLMPNVPNIAKNPKYRPYHGKMDASEAERKQFLKTLASGAQAPRQVIVPAEPFDLGKASKEEMILFAYEEYGVALDSGMHGNAMRARIAELAKQANALLQATGNGGNDLG